MENIDTAGILAQFEIKGMVKDVKPLGNGLINDTYHVITEGAAPDYVLQRINNAIFQDVDLLQHNIEVVTAHIRRRLEACNTDDIDRRVLQFVKARSGKTYYRDEADRYWRVMVYIPDTVTNEAVTPESAYDCGKAFGNFEKMLVDVPEPLGETIPDFHNMELRMRQLREAVANDAARRLDEVIRNLKQPVLGICIGQQLLCRHTEEGDVDCIGIFDADVKRFCPERHEDKVPCMGWNGLRVKSEKLKVKSEKIEDGDSPSLKKDLRGVACPMNFVKTKIELSTMQSGQLLEILLDDGQPIQNVPGSVRQEGHEVLSTEKVDDYWKVVIRKR